MSKLLLLTYGCSVGGCELHLLHLARGLKAGGWNVHLAYFLELAGASRSLVEDFAAAGVVLHDLGGVPWWDPRSWRRLAALLRSEEFTLLHTHLPGPDLVGAFVARVVDRRLPRVVSVHNDTRRDGLGYPRPLLRWAWGTADARIAISNAVRRHLEDEIGLPRGRTKVIPYGVPALGRTDGARLRIELALGSTEPLLLNVGRLVPQKGQMFLIDAMPEILRVVPNCHLAIIGHAENSYGDVLQERVTDKGLERRVHILGYRDVGRDTMAEAQVFVFPSLWEGFGLAVIEAMQAGLATVCSAVGPLSEIVLDGETGLLVPPGDVTALAASVVRMLRSPQLAKRLGENGRRRVYESFSVHTMVQKTQALYASVPEQPRDAGQRLAWR